MADRAPDPDDWWATPAPVTTTAPSAPAPVEDDWVDEPQYQATPPRERPPFEATRGIRIAAAALGVLVLVVVGLYLAGVFDSSKKPVAPPSTPANTTTVQTTTTTPAPRKTTRVPAPTVAVSFGASGTPVKVLQRALASLGDKPGPVDGDYGPLTKAAVEKFQTSAKLVPDGIVGPKTLAALKRALSA